MDFFLNRDSCQVIINHDLYCDILYGLYQHEVWESLEDKELESESTSKVASVGCGDLISCAHVSVSVLEHQCSITLNAAVQPQACSKSVNQAGYCLPG